MKDFRWKNRNKALDRAKEMVLAGQDPVVALRAIINGQVYCAGKKISQRGWINFLSQVRKETGILEPYSPGPRARKVLSGDKTQPVVLKKDVAIESIEQFLCRFQ